MTITQLPGQNLFDLALQHYGDARALFALVADNPSLALDRPWSAPGTQYQVRPDVYGEPLANATIARAYQRTGTQPASGNDQPCGIGWMEIENTFIVGANGNPCAGVVPPDPDATGGSFDAPAFDASFDQPTP